MKSSQLNKNSFTIVIDDQYCKGCNLCLQVCPQKIFTRGEKRSRGGYWMPDVGKMEDCAGCLLCEMTCPDLAISVLKGKK